MDDITLKMISVDENDIDRINNRAEKKQKVFSLCHRRNRASKMNEKHRRRRRRLKIVQSVSESNNKIKIREREKKTKHVESAKVFHPPLKFKCYFWTHSIEHSTRIRTSKVKEKKSNEMSRKSEENSLLHAYSSIICVQI